MRRSLSLLLALPALLLAGCPKNHNLDACTPELEKGATARALYDWYLYPDLLPLTIDVGSYATPADVVDAMTAEARRQGLDRGWTFVTTASANQTFFEAGTAVGAGLGLLERDPDRLLVSQVYPGSAADAAGFERGDQILRIGESEATLAPVAPAVVAGIADPNDPTLGQMIGPATEGLVRVFEVIPRGAAPDAAPVVRPVTKGPFGLDPVPAVGPAGERWTILDSPGGKKIGYLALRSFISPADSALRQAVQAMKDAGVDGAVVDLRYNGGGLVATGELLANLLGGGISGTMWKLHNSALRAAVYDSQEPFSPPAAALGDVPIAFITTGASASASELVPNVLEPYRTVALVGARTFGKPVGQRVFQVQGCDTVVAVVSFFVLNAQDDGGYFEGLPDVPAPGSAPRFSGPLCGAEDDLTKDFGDASEASLAAALAWIDAGGGADACPPAPAAPAAKLGLSALRLPDAYPAAPEPSLAQRHVSGLF